MCPRVRRKKDVADCVDLLGKGNPLLIHGAFTRLMPMGCLASHIAWNHPKTRELDHEAGVVWLSKVAGLNPALSAVILAWDRAGNADFDLRADFYEACIAEQTRRSAASSRSRSSSGMRTTPSKAPPAQSPMPVSAENSSRR